MATIDEARAANQDKRKAQFKKNADFLRDGTLLCVRSYALEKRPDGSGWSFKLFIVWRDPGGRLVSQHTWLPAAKKNADGSWDRDEYRYAILKGIDYPAHATRLETAPNSRYIEITGPHGRDCPCGNATEEQLQEEIALTSGDEFSGIDGLEEPEEHPF